MRNLKVEQQYSPSLGLKRVMDGFTTDINAPYTFSSSLPTQVFKVYAKNNATTNYSRIIGEKSYELNDHLGNFNDTWVLSSKTLSGINPVRNLSEATGIRVVISDRKYLADRDDNNTITTGDNFVPEVLSANEYGAFGNLLNGRGFSQRDYRYGFQGQLLDDEVKGNGNSLNYKYRMHDPRIGRFFAVDPLASDFPWNSSYAFSENRVIDAIELEGAEALLVIFVNYGGKTHIRVMPDETVIENAKSDFQIKIPANTFAGQDEELIYRKNSSTTPNPKFDFIELQQNLYSNLKINASNVIFNGKEYGTSTGYGGSTPTNNMAPFIINIAIESLTGRRVSDFSQFINLSGGSFNGVFTAPASSTGVAYYDINVTNFEIAGTGTENPFSITDLTTGTVLFNNVTILSTGGNIQFQIPSGNQFQLTIQLDPNVDADIFNYTGTEAVGL
jgi:RHS repeat-associated protein